MDIERIATLKAAGLPSSSIATIVGVSPARISQIEKQEDFTLLYSEKLAVVKEKDIEEVSLSAKYTAAEHALIEQMMQMAPIAELRDVTAALRVVAERQEKAKSRMNPVLQQVPTINNIVALQLPMHALPEMILNSEKEVIAIGNRNLTPLSSSGVLSLFDKLRKPASSTLTVDAEGENHEQTRTFGSTEESTPKAIPNQGLVAGASRFLQSLRLPPVSIGV